MGDFVHAPNATQVHIANEESSQSNTVYVEWGRLGAFASDATQRPTRDFINAPNATQVNVVHQGVPLDGLPKHPEMSAKLAEYLPDSRQPEVEELCGRESSGTDLVLYIHGPAGIGKSTLAGHLCNKFRSEGRLAASIFLGAVPATTSGPEAIIKMAAREIGLNHPRAIPKIVEAINGCHGSSLETHLQKYIVEPLRSLQHFQPFIIIIDAMDEWPDHPLFVKPLASLNAQSDIVKFIVTDRLNPRASSLPGAESVSIYTFALGPIRKEVIRAFFQKHFESVPWVDGRKATPADVEKLTELSEGLPVWAATVVTLLSFRFSESPPHRILEEILGSRRPVGGPKGLAELYRKALARLFPDPEDREWLRRFLGAIISLQEPLPLFDFETLTGIPSHLTRRICTDLSAVQTRSPPPGSETMVHPAAAIFHLSLLEYVQATTTKEAGFDVSTFASHSVLGLACIEQVLQLPPSASSVSHLRAHQLYAVKYWLLHLSKGTTRLKTQWVQTKHWSMLQKFSTFETLRRWATLFVESVLQWNVDFTTSSQDQRDDIVSFLDCLYNAMEDSGEDCWGFQVACMEVAVRMTNGDDDRAWTRLGECYKARGEGTGSLEMHEDAVAAFRCALDLRSGLHPNRASTLDNLANCLSSCYNQNGNIDLLKEATSLRREALGLCPPPHPLRDLLLNNIAINLQSLYDRDGDIAKLNDASSLHREALALRPAPHPDRASSLSNLANTLHSHYEHYGDVAKLTEASSLRHEVLSLCPAPHPGRALSLNNSASTLRSLYEHDGDVAKLIEASSLHREALALRPAPHPDCALYLNNLANTLGSLHDIDGDVAKLIEASSFHREALALRPAPHPDRSSSLNNLANTLQSLYQPDGDVTKLTEANLLLREALALLPMPRSAHHWWCLDSLADVLQLLYNRDGHIDRLNEVVSLSCEALALLPAPHPDRASPLHNLARAYQSLYKHHGNISSLNMVESLCRELLALRPAPYPHRHSSLNNLTNALLSLYHHDGDVAKLTEASSLHREALALCPAPHPDCYALLRYLAKTFWFQFKLNGSLDALEEAILLFRERLVLRPPGSTSRQRAVKSLLRLLVERREATGDDRDNTEVDDLEAELAGLQGEE
ncbi:hypothetical protein MD484_g5296, partial [Candolleomyces efflorescens]